MPRKFTSAISRQLGAATQFKPGQSGNPDGRPRSRREFDQAFHDALVKALPVEDAAVLLAKAARAGEAWAVQEVCKRYSPQATNLNLKVERDDAGLDLNRLSDADFQQFARLIEAAANPASRCGRRRAGEASASSSAPLGTS